MGLRIINAFDSFKDNADSVMMHNGFIVSDDMISASFSEGSEDKFFININNKQYLVKDSSFNYHRKSNSLAPYCEYVGSNFIRLSGLLDCQQTYLGQYSGRPVVICEDIFFNRSFRPFEDLHQSSAGTDLDSKEYTYSDVLYVLQQKSKLEDSDMSNIKTSFWFMFLFDAVLGNRDRHGGNWGFIKENSITRLAPILDNGSSLFPDVDLSNWKHYDFVNTRVFQLPASQFKMWRSDLPDRPRKTNFYDIITNYSDEFRYELDCISKLDYHKLIEQSIIDVPSGIAEWFSIIIECRFRVLILGEDFNNVWYDIARRNNYDLH